MKKITLISIILVLISISPLVAQETIFEDDFESYTVGTFPSNNWFLKYSGSGTENQVVVDNQYVSPTQSLLLECNPNWAGTADVQLSQTPSIIYCEGYLKSEHEFGGPDFGFQNPDIGPWGTAYASVGVCKNGNITCNDQVLQTSEANKWYHIKIKYDSYMDLCDVWIDGVHKGKDIPCSTNGNYTILRLSTHNPSYSRKGWYDDIKVYTDTDEPTVTVNSPNGGEYWKWDTQQLINWTANDSIIENVNIWLSYDSGASYDDLLFENTANDGEEPWTIPEAQCNTARIKIDGYDVDGHLIAEDQSNGDFFIYTSPPVSLDSGLVAYYPFNGNANDESENVNNGEVLGASNTSDRFGEYNKAYGYDGIDDYINTSGYLGSINNFTISVWIIPLEIHEIDIESTSGWSGVSGQHYVIEPTHGSIWSANHAGAGISAGTNGISVYEHDAYYMPAILSWEGNINGWTHILVMYKNGQPYLYVDGIHKKTGMTSLKTVHPSISRFGCGEHGHKSKMPGQFFSYFEGFIDDIRIYDRVLNEFEIQALYHKGDWKIKPSFVTELNDQAACKNDSVALEAIAEGIPPINYQWQKEGIDIPGATDSILIIPHVQAEDDGEYRCTATNEHGKGTSNTATLSVEFVKLTIISGFTSVHEYQVATYSADNQEGHTYEFIVVGGNVIDGTENSVTVHWGEPGQGFISLIEWSELGCSADTNTLDVTIGYLGIEDHETNNLSVFPNPFSTSTTIEYTLIQPQTVKITFYNQAGKVVDGFENRQQKGLNKFIWTPSNLPNGVYYFKLEVNTEASVGKILLAAH